ncbi:DUF4102 domain-containing protein [Pseudothauera nasutitermitis]|uniref:DUF4102 domain-containing protein n=1 Tax=Pseudothauera nasutitermitis TaxID=2565930 RepID=A0A4S4AQI0_9RHOO|nr:integrase arm-type DNA-binding domain-containing protein [Pseudothauera nasutitermitis]THF61437.1 DUF4102 domain-containing protein [Pseudothauera nasutitermitis]
MPTNRLTDAQCRGAKPGEKPIKLFDGGGLYLYITPAGTKVWRIAYRIAGKPQTAAPGPYPAVSLADARAALAELKAQLRAGNDPRSARRAAKKGMTLSAATDGYMASRRDLSPSYLDNMRRGLEMHVLPYLGQRVISTIGRDDLLEVLLRMDAAGRYSYVRKVRMWVGQVFEWAIERGEAQINPAALIRPEKAFTRVSVQHFAAVELRDVPALMQRLALEGDLQSVLACRMLAYTWVRTTELRMMEWAEIDEQEGVWLIPAGKMKRRRDHLVPLSRQAVEILRTMRPRCRGTRYVWEGDRSPTRPMSENAVLALLHRIGYRGEMTGHGWRSVGSTWANEHGYSPDAIERQLAHVPENETRAAYNRAKYMPERRKMLQAWADWLEACSAASG